MSTERKNVSGICLQILGGHIQTGDKVYTNFTYQTNGTISRVRCEV